MGLITRTRSFVRGTLGRLAKPLRQSSGGEFVIESYRGFGTRQEVYLVLRVSRRPEREPDGDRGDLRRSLKRLFRRGVSGQAVTARIGDVCERVTTDGNGYGHVRLSLNEPVESDTLWHKVSLELETATGVRVAAESEVLVAPESADLLVVSDIDDTVMLTGVASKLRMFWRLFALGARSRLAFPGVAALYRAFHGAQHNPIIYVSRSPWSIYAMLDTFFQRHHIPVGPVMLLRDWGVSLRRPWPRRAADHKLNAIRAVLDIYRELPVVLIGDSGQHDPETYAQIVHEHPGQVRAVYIRDVSLRLGRAQAIEALAREVAGAGARLMLAGDSLAMARNAAELGLVPADTPERVAEELGRNEV